jgi:hypothetical protein
MTFVTSSVLLTKDDPSIYPNTDISVESVTERGEVVPALSSMCGTVRRVVEA